MPVQPLKRSELGTLMNGVVVRHPECIPLGDRPLLAGAVHRIDADTSGLVLVARTAEAFEGLRGQFAAQTVEKTYLALVEGTVAVGGTLENDLVHDPTLPFCRMIDVHHNRLTRAQCEGLKPLHAVTNFKPVEFISTETEEQTLLEVTIFTGVTHQIRAQLAIAGMHIVNDRLYGAFAVENMTGHRLHALAAKFRHPVSGEQMDVRTPYPRWAAAFGRR
jgi:23S rRNA pseudouridine1911/1915/1917 synthase